MPGGPQEGWALPLMAGGGDTGSQTWGFHPWWLSIFTGIHITSGNHTRPDPNFNYREVVELVHSGRRKKKNQKNKKTSGGAEET